MTVSPSNFRSLAELMEETAADIEQDEIPDGHDIARISNRVPRAVLAEVAAIARANRMSTNLLINLLLDNYLRAQGRAGYVELAPWFPDYVLRNK